MANTKYKLRYLPLFYKDLEEKIVYIFSGVSLLFGIIAILISQFT